MMRCILCQDVAGLYSTRQTYNTYFLHRSTMTAGCSRGAWESNCSICAACFFVRTAAADLHLGDENSNNEMFEMRTRVQV